MTSRGDVRFSLVKNCAANAYDAIPKVIIKIDVRKALAVLTGAGYREIADAGVLCVVERDGIESTIYAGGRILVKTDEESVADEVAAEIYAIISDVLD